MSKISLTPDASGTGTFTIASPNSNTDRVLSLPDQTGTILTTATAGVPVNGPAFSAYINTNQSLAANTFTKVQFNTEEFDTNSNFDSATNYRFTPTVAGYYQFNSVVYVSVAPSSVFQVLFYKNGAAYKQAFYLSNASSGATMVGGSLLTYMNGSTDYIEVYANSQSANTIGGAVGSIYTQFSGFLARSAT